MSEEESIRLVIADDEAPARTVLREYLDADPRFEIVAECANGFEAVKAVNDVRPDLLLLDIQMPKLDGFEVIELLEWKPLVVFVTAYDEYAVRAFEVHAVDYLLKPFSLERLRRVLDHVVQLRAEAVAQPLERVRSEARKSAGPLQRIAVRKGAEIEVIPLSRVEYFEAEDDYVAIVSSGKRHLKQQTLSELEEILDPGLFVRVHRSYIVNIAAVARVELYAKDSRVAMLRDGSRIPISRTGYARLRELL